MTNAYDGVLYVAFGGPERPEDVMPFLEHVVRGRPIPRERLVEVAHHYDLFGGVSPINESSRRIIAAAERAFGHLGVPMPIALGNRHSAPFIADGLRALAERGARRVLAFVAAPFSSYSSCRQYLEAIERARAEVGVDAPVVEKLRGFFNHPRFLHAVELQTRAAFQHLETDRPVRLVFTAHSLPIGLAESSAYVAQFREVAAHTARALDREGAHDIAYQSRSGAPGSPWLEPDVGDVITRLGGEGARQIIVSPIGFLSPNIEIRYDLDVVASEVATEVGVRMVRANPAGTSTMIIGRMIAELTLERIKGEPRRAYGSLGALPDSCAANCCPPPVYPTRPRSAA